MREREREGDICIQKEGKGQRDRERASLRRVARATRGVLEGNEERDEAK